MASIPPEKSKFGIRPGPSGDEQRAPREAAGGEETQLRIHLMEGLNDPLHRIPLTLAIGSIRPEQQLQLHDGTIAREGELRWLPTFQLQIPIERVEAALPTSKVELKLFPLTTHIARVENRQVMQWQRRMEGDRVQIADELRVSRGVAWNIRR